MKPRVEPCGACSRKQSAESAQKAIGCWANSSIAVSTSLGSFELGPEVQKLMESCLSQMKPMGATLVDPADLPSYGRYDGNENMVLQYEFKNDLNAYLEARGTDLTLEKLIAFK